MNLVMRIDIAQKLHLIIVGCIAVCWLIICIIVGSNGPPVYDKKSYFAYECPENRHTWGNDCEGIQMNNSLVVWQQDVSNLSPLNDFWILEVFPFTNPNSKTALHKLKIRVDLLAQKNEEYVILAFNKTREEEIECLKGKNECTGFLLVYEEFIRHPDYRVAIQFLSGNAFVTDVKFKFMFGHPQFARLEMGFRLTYLFISLLFTAYFIFELRKVPITEWSWEQRSILVMFVGLLCYNDPFFPFTFAVSGWFFPFMSALFEVTFSCILLLFWLLMMDKIRKDELKMNFSFLHIPKLVFVILYGILSLVLFAWISIRDENDPIYGTGVTGIQVLFYIVTILWTGIIIWITILSFLSIAHIKTKPYLYTRFLFFVVPTGLCILSLLIGIFSGTFGPFHKTTLSFMYYSGMFNIYVFVLAWGYFPIKDRFRDPNAVTENSSLTAFIRTRD